MRSARLVLLFAIAVTYSEVSPERGTRSARRLAIVVDRKGRSPEDASHIRTATIPIQSRANQQPKRRKRLNEIRYLAPEVIDFQFFHSFPGLKGTERSALLSVLP